MTDDSGQRAVTKQHGDTGRGRRGEKARSLGEINFDCLFYEFWILAPGFLVPCSMLYFSLTGEVELFSAWSSEGEYRIPGRRIHG